MTDSKPSQLLNYVVNLLAAEFNDSKSHIYLPQLIKDHDGDPLDVGTLDLGDLGNNLSLSLSSLKVNGLSNIQVDGTPSVDDSNNVTANFKFGTVSGWTPSSVTLEGKFSLKTTGSALPGTMTATVSNLDKSKITLDSTSSLSADGDTLSASISALTLTIPTPYTESTKITVSIPNSDFGPYVQKRLNSEDTLSTIVKKITDQIDSSDTRGKVGTALSKLLNETPGQSKSLGYARLDAHDVFDSGIVSSGGKWPPSGSQQTGPPTQRNDLQDVLKNKVAKIIVSSIADASVPSQDFTHLNISIPGWGYTTTVESVDIWGGSFNNVSAKLNSFTGSSSPFSASFTASFEIEYSSWQEDTDTCFSGGRFPSCTPASDTYSGFTVTIGSLDVSFKLSVDLTTGDVNVSDGSATPSNLSFHLPSGSALSGNMGCIQDKIDSALKSKLEGFDFWTPIKDAIQKALNG